MRLLKQLTNIQNASAGAHMQIICPVRGTYDKITLFYGGIAPADTDFVNLQVKCNGEAIWDFATMADLRSYNKYWGYYDAAGQITFWFNRKHMKQLADQRIFGIGTLDLDTFTIEADIDATAPADLTVNAQAWVSDQQALGVFTRIRKLSYNSAVAGQVDVDKIPVGQGRLMALHLKKADISDVETYVNDAKVYEASKTQSEREQNDYGRTPQTAAFTHVDFILDDDAAQAIVTEASTPNEKKVDLLVKPTLDTAGAVTIYAEYLDTLTLKKAA